MAGRIYDGFVPGRHLIDSFGNGGFRFAEMSHRGSILALPSGIKAWSVSSAAEFTPEAFADVIAEAAEIEVLLVGTGPEIRPLPEAVRTRLKEVGLRLDAMATAFAAQTYNIMAAEERRVAAALIAV
ncbi:MAG TPA: MTH938/NDUFAF3 family protein [Beijerinckiaceae bacterium]|jgi:uncharacterized protein